MACLQMVVTVFQIVLKWQDLCSSEFGEKSNVHLSWPRPALSQQGRGGGCWLWTLNIKMHNKVE